MFIISRKKKVRKSERIKLLIKINKISYYHKHVLSVVIMPNYQNLFSVPKTRLNEPVRIFELREINYYLHYLRGRMLWFRY